MKAKVLFSIGKLLDNNDESAESNPWTNPEAPGVGWAFIRLEFMEDSMLLAFDDYRSR
jgi:hypothetical protein